MEEVKVALLNHFFGIDENGNKSENVLTTEEKDKLSNIFFSAYDSEQREFIISVCNKLKNRKMRLSCNLTIFT